MAIAIDFETFYSKKLRYSQKVMIAEQYVRHELFHPYLLAVCDGTTSWAGDPRKFNWVALEGQVIVSHNKYFDYTVWLEMARRGWCPQPNFAAYHCTANMTSYLCNRRALDSAVEFLFKIKLDKSVRESAVERHWPADFSEAEQAAMLKYAPADAYWCWKLWDTYNASWPELEQRLSNQTIAQGMRGVQINTALLNDYIIQTHEIKLNTENTIPWIRDSEEEEWEDFKKNSSSPTSTKCIAEQCRLSGIPCPPVKAHEGEEAYEEWQALYAPAHPWVSALGSWRSINKLYKTFLLMKDRIRDDGTMPFALLYFGAHTGRWSGSERINFQNPRKKPLFANETGLMELSESRIDAALKEKKISGKLPAWVRHSIDFRSLIIPRPGRKMITSDLSQIEPRVLAWLCGNQELLAAIRGGQSVYEAFARTSMGYTGPKMDKDSDYYKMIKIQVLGLGYQAGWEKFIVIAADGGVDITKDDPEFIDMPDPFTGEVTRESGYGLTSKKIVATFRERNKKIVDLWGTLDTAFKRSIAGDFVVTLPSGRKMSYRDVKASIRLKVDEKTGKPKRSWVFTAESNWMRKIYYGGKLAENITQATAREVFAEHLVALEDAGHTVLFTSHDEVILETDMSVQASDIASIMSRCPDWLPGCPIAADAKIVEHYCK